MAGFQLALCTDYSYRAFITERESNPREPEAGHRRHAETENASRDLKRRSFSLAGRITHKARSVIIHLPQEGSHQN